MNMVQVMPLRTTESIKCDVLVIGGGCAGLRAAIEAKKNDLDVVLVSESPVGFANNSAISGGTFAATSIWKGSGDSAGMHVQDTIASGRFLNDRSVVEAITQAATQQVYDLARFGVNFRKRDGDLLVRHIPGHTYPRQVSGEAFKGINFTRPMRQHAISMGVRTFEGTLVTKLLRAEDMVVGAMGIGKGTVFVVNAKSVILATGGAGQLYLRTNNALGLTGDGYVLAYDVGAKLRDMEFVQFYPTSWGENGSKMFYYERLLPRGATIRNSLGEDILKRHGMDDFSQVTRDRLARTIIEEIMEGRGIENNVFLDFSTIPQDEARKMYRARLMTERAYGTKAHVAPTAHFFMGGVKVNEDGETGLEGLYAAGEVCGGAHGANRLGGNAISETLVFGAITGDKASGRASKMRHKLTPQSEVAAEVERLNALVSGTRGRLDELKQSLKQTMWDKVGVIRDGNELQDAQRQIVALRDELSTVSLRDYRQLFQAIKLANMLTVAEMVCRAALMRTESRGAHYRVDYEKEDDRQWLKTIEICCQSSNMTLRVIPVEGASASNESEGS